MTHKRYHTRRQAVVSSLLLNLLAEPLARDRSPAALPGSAIPLGPPTAPESADAHCGRRHALARDEDQADGHEPPAWRELPEDDVLDAFEEDDWDEPDDGQFDDLADGDDDERCWFD